MEIGAKEVSGGGEIIGSEDSTCWEESCGEDEEIIGEETWRAGDRSCDEIGNEVSLGRGEDEACSAGGVSVLTCCIWTEDRKRNRRYRTWSGRREDTIFSRKSGLVKYYMP
jgi:hypothetical protein